MKFQNFPNLIGIAVFGLIGLTAFIAACCGYEHQLLIAFMSTVMVLALWDDDYLDELSVKEWVLGKIKSRKSLKSLKK